MKTFSLAAEGTSAPINSLRFRLSKEHGLIEYVPFGLFLFHPSYMRPWTCELIGLEKDNVVHGYHQPGFQDYFHLAPGDVLLWENYTDPGWFDQGPPYYEYARDSVTDALITADSAVYTYYRAYKHADRHISVHPRRYHAIIGRHMLGCWALLRATLPAMARRTTGLSGQAAH
ncbi:MAG: hypothetical protein QM724_04020 [Flavobacteriales bacterium]